VQRYGVQLFPVSRRLAAAPPAAEKPPS